VTVEDRVFAEPSKIEAVICIKLDRLTRSTPHLVTLAGDLEALGVDLVAVGARGVAPMW
jgi:DNA invertase Pin-like site-specific DNA recombinase